MERDPARLLEEVRAALVAMLLDRLDDSVDADAEAQWAVEIARRIQDLDSGNVKLVPWSSARRMISGR